MPSARPPIALPVALVLASLVPAGAGPMPPAASAVVRESLALSQYRSASADLDGDGLPEFIIYSDDPETCGTGGCTLYVVACERAACRVVLRAPAVRTPIRVLETSINGWRDLAATRSGGGAYPPYTIRVRFALPYQEGTVADMTEMNERESLGHVIIR